MANNNRFFTAEGGLLKNVLTICGTIIVLLNFKGAILDPRGALRELYGIRHENTIQVHLMQLCCCLRTGMGMLMILSRGVRSKERTKIGIVVFVTMLMALKGVTDNPIPGSKFSIYKFPTFGLQNTKQLEFKLLVMATMIGAGLIAHAFEPVFLTKDKIAKKA